MPRGKHATVISDLAGSMAATCSPIPPSGITPKSGFAPVAKHYGAVVVPCPPRRGNRKGAVECGVKFCCGRWWRTMTATTPEEAQVSLDRSWATTGDARLRPPGRYADPGQPGGGERPAWPTVGELADAETPDRAARRAVSSDVMAPSCR